MTQTGTHHDALNAHDLELTLVLGLGGEPGEVTSRW